MINVEAFRPEGSLFFLLHASDPKQHVYADNPFFFKSLIHIWVSNCLTDLLIWLCAHLSFNNQTGTLDFMSHFFFSKPVSTPIIPAQFLALPFTQRLKLETSF